MYFLLLLLFSFYKIREREGRIGPAWEVGTSGSREEVGKGHGRMNIVKILRIHASRWKNETC
jgi:hypothetical protein